MSTIIYTDGACSRNPGPGNWGLVAVDSETDEVVAAGTGGRIKWTTNNEMELKAILVALKEYGVDQDEFQYPVVYTDSNYAFKTLTEWYQGWKRNGWKRPKNQLIANLELIQEYDALWESGKRIELRWVRGHNGNRWNEIADKLATGKLTPEEVTHREIEVKIFEK